MNDNKEIVTLLKNIQEGLKHYTPEELNDALVKVLSEKHDKAPEIDFILSSVASKYDISRRTLLKSSARGEIQQARTLAYCLLHINLGLSIRHIAQKIFVKKYHNSVAVAIKYYRNCDQKIPSERDFLQKYEALKIDLIRFIQDQNNNQ